MLPCLHFHLWQSTVFITTQDFYQEASQSLCPTLRPLRGTSLQIASGTACGLYHFRLQVKLIYCLILPGEKIPPKLDIRDKSKMLSPHVWFSVGRNLFAHVEEHAML